MTHADSQWHNDHVTEAPHNAVVAADLSDSISNTDYQSVFKLKPKGSEDFDLDFRVALNEPNKTPEEQLQQILSNLPKNMDALQFSEEATKAADVRSEQLDRVQSALDEYYAYEKSPVVKQLVEQLPTFENISSGLGPDLTGDSKFMNMLKILPMVIFSGQTSRAEQYMQDLLAVAGGSDKGQLQEYFTQIDRVATNNPGVVRKFTELGATLDTEIELSQKLKNMVNDSPLAEVNRPKN